MHVRKSILAIIALVILALTAALAYTVGKSDRTTLTSTPAEAFLPKANLDLLPAKPVEMKAKQQPLPANVAAPIVPKDKSFTRAEQRLIDNYFKGEDMCRGSSDPAVVEEWCPRRDDAYTAMTKAGICYGHENDQSAADYDIHRCRKGSNR
jgi:type IV secretory pathway VirB10-like protein